MTAKRAANSGETTSRQILHALRRNPHATVQDLVTTTKLSRPTIHRHLTQLETDGHVQRHRSDGPDQWSARMNTADPNHEPHPSGQEPGVEISAPTGTAADAPPVPGVPGPGPGHETPDAQANVTNRDASTRQAEPGDGEAPSGEPTPPQTSHGSLVAPTTPGPDDESGTPAVSGADSHQDATAPPARTPEHDAPEPEAGTTADQDNGGSKRKGLHKGQLRARVAELLNADPSKAWKTSEISNKLQKSSGAISNALDRLVERGTARLVEEKPRTFQAVPSSREPADPGHTASEPPGHAEPEGADL